MSPQACFSNEPGLVSCANGINKWERLVLFLQMSCQGKHIFYCLVSTSSPSSRVLTAVPKLWFAFQCQSGNNVVEILDVPWSAAWTSLPFISCLTCLTGQGISHKAKRYFPALLNACHSVCPFWFHITLDHLNKNLCCSTSYICSFQNATSMPCLLSSGINTSSHTTKARFCKSDEY